MSENQNSESEPPETLGETRVGVSEPVHDMLHERTTSSLVSLESFFALSPNAQKTLKRIVALIITIVLSVMVITETVFAYLNKKQNQ